MKLFFEVYKDTINPLNNYNILVSYKVLTVIFIHLIFYYSSYRFLVKLFDLPNKSDLVFGFLIIILVVGYFGRLARSKSIFRYFIEKGFDEVRSIKLTNKYMNNAYFKWYFLS